MSSSGSEHSGSQKPRKSKSKTKKLKQAPKYIDDQDSEDMDHNQKPKRKKPKQGAQSGKASDEQEDLEDLDTAEKDLDPTEEEYKWWLADLRTDGIKWTTLAHSGPIFADPYIPHHVPLIYNQQQIKLSANVEEVASFFAALVGTENANNPTFQKNFMVDFRALIQKHESAQLYKLITTFSLLDFSLITERLEEMKVVRKNMSKEEKLKIKQEKAAIDAVSGYCYIDGRKEKVGNYRIEPPGLFRGRGDHPRTGCLKARIMPEQVTINISKDSPIPPAPAGHQWGAVVYDCNVAWLATWNENVNDNHKYVQLAANSSLKGMSDFKKFEKARELKNHVETIRASYQSELTSDLMADRQRATALYFIDKLALRAGNEKGEDETDTVGCCSLRFEHVTLQPPNKLIFDFLGKDSIRYYNEVEVIPQVFKNLKVFKRDPKKDGDPLFDRLNVI